MGVTESKLQRKLVGGNVSHKMLLSLCLSVENEKDIPEEAEEEETTTNENPKQEPFVVAAIDFSNNNIRYAYSYTNNQDKVYLNENWGLENGEQSLSVPSSVLYDANGTFQAFGYAAEEQYYDGSAGIKKASMKPNLYRICGKVLMVEQQTDSNYIFLTSENNTKILAKKVFVDVLSVIKEHVLGCIELSRGSLNSAPIHWVLIVPPGWKDKQRIFFREAAVQAGLVEHLHSEHLVTIHSMECATHFCQMGLTDEISHSNEKKSVLILDLGALGESVEMNMHKFSERGLEKVQLPNTINTSSGKWNCPNICEAFESLLEKSLGEKFVRNFKATSPRQWAALIKQFQCQIRCFNGSKDISIPLHYKLASSYNEFCKKAWFQQNRHIREVFAENNNNNLGMTLTENGLEIVIHSEVVKKFFNDPVDNIYNYLLKVLSQTANEYSVSHAFIIGSFADIPYVQKVLQRLEFYYTNTKVVTLREADMCGIRGAVTLGHRILESSDSNTRKSKFTYSILMERKYKDGDIMGRIKEDVSSTVQTVDYLNTVVEVGEMVPEYAKIVRCIQMGSKLQAFTARFFMSESKTDDDPSSRGAKELGTVHVSEVKKFQLEEDRVITLEVLFGKEEMQIKATDNISKKVTEKFFPFSCTY